MKIVILNHDFERSFACSDLKGCQRTSDSSESRMSMGDGYHPLSNAPCPYPIENYYLSSESTTLVKQLRRVLAISLDIAKALTTSPEQRPVPLPYREKLN
ncbi:hypothetical protein EVAR_97142_1 [Eumeta japonica]|uniref:Uncharacterized protein n=1 Tax=Eumeta variegata TaxID=151549 RepID=A0A4C1SKC3_EUMVA|nr:hypothetical protein EVAR_97142_1 [Eumeta japonica]